MRPLLCLAAVLALGVRPLTAETVHWVSTVTYTTLIELFTSEGCSSCPPAERWFGKLASDTGLWREFVPIAYHVDYWNRLGWQDRFSSKASTDREYTYAAAWHSTYVYTPCFAQDGAEWHREGTLRRSKATAGVLSVSYDGAVVRAEFKNSTGEPHGEKLEIHAALLGGGITSKVLAGENRGETLQHEFVALASANGVEGESISLPRRSVDGVKRYALAVWVTRRGEHVPLQATGGWLD